MLIRRRDAPVKELGKNCTVTEYHFSGVDSISMAVSDINGRLPEDPSSMMTNLECDEIYFVLSGTGRVSMLECGDYAAGILGTLPNPPEFTNYDIAEGDCLFIARRTIFSVEGDKLRLALPTAPRWGPDQHKLVRT